MLRYFKFADIMGDIHDPILNTCNSILNTRKMGTDSLNVSANIDIDSDPKGFETQKPLLFGKNLDRHP